MAEPHKLWWKDKLFLAALVVAMGSHVAVGLISFVMPESKDAATKDVTIAVNLQETPDEEVKDADFQAQANQKGDGDLKEAHTQTTPIPSTDPDTSLGAEQEQVLQELKQKEQLDFKEQMLMTTLSWQKQKKNEEAEKDQKEVTDAQQARAVMIASIEAQFAQRQQMYAKQQKVKTVTGIQAKKDASAAYLDRFRQKVEMFGNRYYPEEAKSQGLSGDVRLMVILNAQGGIRAIRLLDTSGHAILDEAAKASVRRAMPFGRFDEGMKDITELRIVRTWRFDANNSAFDVQ
ncbi:MULTISPECIES: energy transducer TonB [unclassified Acinetobacter]|uniref:energy transducer TonB n=1 Tax=unclassified Acinetobacter TaxID=196816 RepID=UPI0035B80865